MRIGLLLIASMVCFLLDAQDESLSWYCPPCNSDCDTIVFDGPDDCPHCGMKLLSQTAEQHVNGLRISQMTIGFYLQNGVEVLDFAGPMEVFSYAGFNVITIARTKDPIISQGILKVIPDYSIDDAPDVDVLAFFGGNGFDSSADPDVQEWISSQDEVQYHFSVCTGAFFLARAGILDGLDATTFHSAIEGLRELAPKATVHSDVRWIDNGSVITTAGVSAGIDGALHFVRKLAGDEAAIRVAEYMEYEGWDPKSGLVIKQ